MSTQNSTLAHTAPVIKDKPGRQDLSFQGNSKPKLLNNKHGAEASHSVSTG